MALGAQLVYNWDDGGGAGFRDRILHRRQQSKKNPTPTDAAGAVDEHGGLGLAAVLAFDDGVDECADGPRRRRHTVVWPILITP